MKRVKLVFSFLILIKRKFELFLIPKEIILNFIYLAFDLKKLKN